MQFLFQVRLDLIRVQRKQIPKLQNTSIEVDEAFIDNVFLDFAVRAAFRSAVDELMVCTNQIGTDEIFSGILGN